MSLEKPYLPALSSPPVRPPVSELVRFGESGATVIQRGVRYSLEWMVDGCYQQAGEAVPVPWPGAVAVEGGGDVFVSFGDVPHPDFVEVRVYGEETGPGGLPSDQPPLQIVECRLSEPRREKRIRRRDDRVGVDLHLPPSGLRHVAAWAFWNVPLLARRRLGFPAETDDVQAAWLFTVRVRARRT